MFLATTRRALGKLRRWTMGVILTGALTDSAVAQDCNNNGVFDDEDIADGTSEDCNDNAIPDECEFGPLHVVDVDVEPDSIHAADLDGDGDMDFLGSSTSADDVSWWENATGDGSAWVEHAFFAGIASERYVFAADIDGDGDMDILSAARFIPDNIIWWENSAGDGAVWVEHLVGEFFFDPTSLHAADIDGDDDLDILISGGYEDGRIAWWENTAGDGETWAEHFIDNFFDGAQSAHAADIDGDGDMDVVAAADDADQIAWWENIAGDGTDWTKRMVDHQFEGASAVYAADIDGDGDIDILGGSWFADEITWWENAGRGDGSQWQEHTVETDVDMKSVHADDVDGDGDIDLLGASSEAIAWWENVSGDGTTWFKRIGDGVGGGGSAIYAADVDGDGNLNILGAFDEEIAWWPNQLACDDIVPEECEDFVPHSVAAEFDGAFSAYAADVDGDDDADIVGAAFDADSVKWWENTLADGGGWVEHTVDDDFDGAIAVHAADIDGDGDLDVLGAAYYARDITWWENVAGDGTTWIEQTIDGNVVLARSVFAADVDNDGDLDVLATGNGYDKVEISEITWWENTFGDGAVWTEHPVDVTWDGADSIHAADIDGDGDTDILTGSHVGSDVSWWENTVGDGSVWIEHLVHNGFSGDSVFAVDLDGDGDVDLLGAGSNDVVWWENTVGDGADWMEHPIAFTFDTSNVGRIYAEDLDDDGHLDVLGASGSDDEITWWENLTGDGIDWAEHVVDDNFENASSVHAADIDGDGDPDIIGAADDADQIAWWENRLGECPTDLDCDFSIGSADLIILLGAWGPNPFHPADFDGDGDVGPSDLIALLGNWGPCP